MPLSTILGQAPEQRIAPKTAIIITCAIALIVATLDFATSADYNIGMFYGIGIATCVWSNSRKFLWTATSILVALVFLVAIIGAQPQSNWPVVWANRSFTAASLLVIAGLVHNWMTKLIAADAERTVSRHLLQSLDLAQVTIRKVDGTILFWSQGAERLYGWSAEEVVGKVTHDVLSATFTGETLEGINKQLERDGQWIGELRHVRKDGTPTWVSSQWTLHTKGLFPFPIVTEVNNDVTELKTANDRFRHLTEVIPHLVWQVSPSGQTTYANIHWHEYFGCDPTEITTTTNSIPKFVHPDDQSKSLTRWAKASRTGQMEPWEVRYRRQDGEYRWFAGRAVGVRDGAGQLLHWIGTATDIEDSKKATERLQETQKLESIGRLAGGVAHDFNNLLTAIFGYHSLLNDDLANNSRALGYSLEIKKAADRAAALTKQLLSFSRPQLPKPKLVNLNTIVTDINRLLGRVIGEDVQLVIDLAPELPDILADPVQMDQIIMNLAVNARDAMPNGGTLGLETGTAEVGDIESRERQVGAGLYVTLTARDTGTGIDERTKIRLFEPFFTTKDRDTGTGLGLSIVFGIVNHAGGFIKVESEIGAGAQFTICLPVSTESQSVQLTAPIEKAASAGGQTILVVEDEESVRHLVCGSLRRRGYTVLEAATPVAGIKLVREYGQQIDLLLSDVLMPEMRGPELVRSVHEFRPDLSILYMSGYSDSTFLDPTTLHGAAYIQKPFKPEELAQKVEAIFEKRK
jgi:PAS domain S-box-containing protein